MAKDKGGRHSSGEESDDQGTKRSASKQTGRHADKHTKVPEEMAQQIADGLNKPHVTGPEPGWCSKCGFVPDIRDHSH